MPKGVKYGPHQLRLISRNEAAAMLGCSASTISNWVERGIIKGHKIDNMLFVDKESIEKLFDTASDVAEMEKKLKELKSQLNDEIQQNEQKVKSLYEDNLWSIQDKFFKELSDSIVDTVKDRLSERDFIIVSGVLKGKPTLEIAKEAGCNVETVRHNWHRITPKLIELINDPTVRQEKEDLAEENQKLKNDISRLKDDISGLKDDIRRLQIDHREQNILVAPFNRDLLDFGFSPQIYRKLISSGCITLADLLEYDANHLLSIPNIGRRAIDKIEERLDMMGLSLGMDLRNMSAQDFNALVENVNDFLPPDDSLNNKSVKQLKIKIQQLKEKVIRLSTENAQLRHQRSVQNQNMMSKEALLRRITSLENLVMYYKKERFSENKDIAANEPLE